MNFDTILWLLYWSAQSKGIHIASQPPHHLGRHPSPLSPAVPLLPSLLSLVPLHHFLPAPICTLLLYVFLPSYLHCSPPPPLCSPLYPAHIVPLLVRFTLPPYVSLLLSPLCSPLPPIPSLLTNVPCFLLYALCPIASSPWSPLSPLIHSVRLVFPSDRMLPSDGLRSSVSTSPLPEQNSLPQFPLASLIVSYSSEATLQLTSKNSFCKLILETQG